MNALVTGVAGFIGSSLADALLERGDRVLGIDCFTPYYDRAAKEANLAHALRSDRFQLTERDLRVDDIDELLDGVDVVYHQAAQAGVRLSWSDGFGDYAGHNILATQRLLEAAKRADGTKVVYASSSSVYGNAGTYPTSEADLPRPHSPYGVTKLAGEHLCTLYAANWSIPTVSLRYFTVYGPRQRPDMAMYRLLSSTIERAPFPLFGDGSAVRDFTYVDDVVKANFLAGDTDCPPGTVVNIAGGSSISMRDLLALVADVAGAEPKTDQQDDQPGDVRRTGGTIDRARELFGWEPETSLRDGLTAQAEWHRSR